MIIEDQIIFLKKHFGSHKKVAEKLGTAYVTYNKWRWNPEEMPEYAKNHIRLLVKDLMAQEEDLNMIMN